MGTSPAKTANTVLQTGPPGQGLQFYGILRRQPHLIARNHAIQARWPGNPVGPGANPSWRHDQMFGKPIAQLTKSADNATSIGSSFQIYKYRCHRCHRHDSGGSLGVGEGSDPRRTRRPISAGKPTATSGSRTAAGMAKTMSRHPDDLWWSEGPCNRLRPTRYQRHIGNSS